MQLNEKYEDEIESVVNYSKGFTAVAFTSSNKCTHCKSVEDKLIESFYSIKDIAILIIDIDKNQDMVSKYSLEYIPTVLIYKKSELIHIILGNQNTETYVRAIKN